jgi:SAM-dependent methyltransferase
MSGAGDDEILAELVDLAEAHPEYGLLQFGSLLSAHQYRDLYRMTRACVPAGARVLDWGAGNGHFSFFLQRAGYEAAGFSLLDAPFRAWLPREGYAFERGDERDPVQLPFPDGLFDGVASVGVLEHVRETGGDERATLREVARILRPGGVFVCYHLPNRWSWIDRAARAFSRLHRHEYRYTRREIEDLTRDAGLSLLACARYGLLPRNFGGRLPRALRRSRAIARAWDAFDALLGLPLSALSQNYRFAASKPGDEVSSGGRTFRNAP